MGKDKTQELDESIQDITINKLNILENGRKKIQII